VTAESRAADPSDLDPEVPSRPTPSTTADRPADGGGSGPTDPAAVPVDPQAPILNVANLLTAARLAMVPLVAWCLVWSGLDSAAWRIVATIAFGVASVTDYVDGALARRYNLVTAFGKVADPIADKALVGTALVLLSAYGPVPWWVTVLILVRELGVTALRFVVIRHGVIPASPGGKLKTLLQSLAIGWLLLPLPD
jgi:CDP-diacylglycerol--glycerol-3-phosphate 3-phosphatidyltransferase